MMSKSNARAPWADFCRLIAMFGVICIHTAAPVFSKYHSNPLDEFLIANAIDSLARVSVPLFIMLSGALLLGKESSKGLVDARDRIIKVAIPLLFWSFIYIFWTNYWARKSFDLFDTLISICHAPVMHHLWFIYMIIGVYIVLPFLRVISSALITDRKSAIYFFTLWFIVNSITIYYPIKFIQLLNLSNFLGWPGYFILGYYLSCSKFLLRINSSFYVLVFYLSSLCTFLITWGLYVKSPIPIQTAYNYFSPNVLIASVGAFLYLRQIKVTIFFVKPLAFLSGIIFPIYFMHLLIIAVIEGGYLGFTITPYSIYPVVGILGLAFVTFFVSMLIAVLLKFIPYSSKIIG